MLPGITGSLISSDFLQRRLVDRFGGRLGDDERRPAIERLAGWWRGVAAQCGPASGVRSLVNSAAVPLSEALGFEVVRVETGGEPWVLTVATGGRLIPLLVVPWQASLDAMWRGAVRYALLHHASWCLVYAGTRLRLLDAARTHARRHLEFDLPLVLEHEASAVVFWALMRAAAFAGTDEAKDGLLGEIVRASEQEGVRVCAALRGGVLQGIEHMLTALASDAAHRRDPVEAADLHGEALTAIYRMLFLLFAEARTLVPSWHPIYRQAYSLEALRRGAEGGAAATGLWDALQAIGRLAHDGCHAGDLAVTAFNGRLFSPARAPRLERARLDDESVRRALLAVSTVRQARGEGRHRIAFGDLGVEELGAVYECLLEYVARVTPSPTHVPARTARRAPVVVRLERTGTAHRKATGTFYTPRSLTQFLVRQTLEPLVHGTSSEKLLDLRVCDPAMGSGAFLVAACNYLAEAYEAALIDEGACAATDVGEHDRAGFRRLVAQRCLYGVDLNPMAVQLARLSLWLTTLAADLPLTFLDHHLVAGDSLLGAGPLELLGAGTAHRHAETDRRQIPLFEPSEFSALLSLILPVRHQLERSQDANAAGVRAKELALATLDAREDLQRWRAACDVWCTNWCLERPSPPGTLRALLDGLLHDTQTAPSRALADHVASARRYAVERGFHHWPLQFPEAFVDTRGALDPGAGFDAVIGNPPWEMLRADAHEGPRRASVAMVRFARRSGLYTARSAGHANQYQLFVDRALALARRGGRIGLVVPGGLAIDAGAAPLRRRLLQECALDVLVGFENRSGVFPIHRSTRFLLVTATRGGRTERVRCRFGLQDPSDLHQLADDSAAHPERAFPVTVTPSLLERLAGPDVAIPYARSATDLQIAERLAAVHPSLSAETGWGARFGRELNATDHRAHFSTTGRGMPVLEGKHVSPFAVRPDDATLWIDRGRARRLPELAGRLERSRLAFRDVAGATNRQTVIAAIVPAGCVTTHTLFCLRTRLSDRDQRVLCALLNSYVVNFLVRQRVTTHVTLAVMHAMPVPRPEPDSPLHAALDQRVRRLLEDGARLDALLPEVQALAAAAFAVTATEYEHVLSTFPLIPHAERRAALDAFSRTLPPESRR